MKAIRKTILVGIVAATVVAGCVFVFTMHAQDPQTTRTRRVGDTSVPPPSVSPTPPEQVPQDSDEVVRVETNLTSIFFTAADKSKRFVNTVKRDDICLLYTSDAADER